MNRIMLAVMIATAVCLHCTFCEWDLCKHQPGIKGARSGQVLYYHYDRAWESDLFLLARSTKSRDQAMLYGLAIPVLLCGAVGWGLRLEGR